MESTSSALSAEQPARRPSAGNFAWSLASIIIAVAIAALGIAVRQAAISGDFRTVLSHQSLTPFVTAGFGLVGALIASRRPRNPIGWIFVAVGVLYAQIGLAAAVLMSAPPASSLYQWAYWLGSWLWLPATLLPVTFVPLVFPDGRLPSPRWRLVAWSAALGLALVVLGVMFHPGSLQNLGQEMANPFGIPAAAPALDLLLTLGTGFLALGVFGSLAALLVRFRHSAGAEREQIKWLVYALGIWISLSVLSSLFGWLWPGFPWALELSIALTSLGILGIAVAAAIAILRHRLYDINFIINRTLVYTTLTAGVAILYGLVVGVLGVLFQSAGNLLLSLLATGLAAILVQPMRDALQHAVNRLMYGDRDDPYSVLSSLSRRLEGALSPEATLPAVVDTIAEALKLPYVAIALKQDGDFAIAASFGLARSDLVQLPLIFQGETIGQLRLSARSPQESFTPGEQRLLRDIARHIGISAHNILLTQDLQRLAGDLQRSREQLVKGREEERRRLRRDLHDGLGPVLASQGLKLAALQQLSQRDAEAAARLLDQLIARNQDIVAELRRLVYDLRPPALDELGLVDAFRDQVMVPTREPGSGLPVQIRVEAPPAGLPPLPAAVEVAAYRIAMEAVANIYRHSQAQTGTARFSIDPIPPHQALVVEICDDGSGLPERYQPGVGLASMKLRAEEVGGTCRVERLQKGGTRVLARFPLAQ